MARRAVLKDMKATLGIVPGFAARMSDGVLEQWWNTAKNFLMADTALPVKTKALIGLSAAATARCRY